MKGGMEKRTKRRRNRPQKSLKKKREIKNEPQNRPKRVPKSTQKCEKTKARGTRNQSKVFKMILDPPWGRFPGYRGAAKCHLGCQNRAKFVKKVMRKIVDFFIALGSEKSEKKESKTTPKWSPRWFKIEPRRKDKTKMGKV